MQQRMNWFQFTYSLANIFAINIDLFTIEYNCPGFQVSCRIIRLYNSKLTDFNKNSSRFLLCKVAIDDVH